MLEPIGLYGRLYNDPCTEAPKCNADAQCRSPRICKRGDGELDGTCGDLELGAQQDLELGARQVCKDEHDPTADQVCLKKHKGSKVAKFSEETCADIEKKYTHSYNTNWCVNYHTTWWKETQRAMMDCCAKTCKFCV
jgi:hypothetical protein